MIQAINKDGEITVFNNPSHMARVLEIRSQNVSKFILSTTKFGECKRGKFRYWKFYKIEL